MGLTLAEPKWIIRGAVCLDRAKDLLRKQKYNLSPKGKAAGLKYRTEKEPHVYRLKKNISLKRQYGISLQEFYDMEEKQCNLCAICGTNAFERALSVDHDHTTGAVRELLCQRCNIFVGYIEKTPGLLLKTVSYLEKHG